MIDHFNFTVCIHCTTYNHEHYIEDALKGFVMQKTSFPFIAVVIDDHSNDRTAEIVRKYAEDYPEIIKAICLEENYYSQGKDKQVFLDPYDDQSKYIAICEGDDYWTDPLKLQKQVDFLESHRDYVMCCSAFSQTFEGDEQNMINIVFSHEDITIDDLLQEYWIGTLTVLFRKSAIEDYRPPFDHLPMGDLPLWCHLATKGKIRYLSDITANYRSLTNSACHFSDLKRAYVFQLEAMRVREYYAIKTNKENVAQPLFRKNAIFFLNQCYMFHWSDFPLEKLWHFVKEYGNPSGYDYLKYWGLKSTINYSISRFILRIKKKVIQ